MSLYNPKIKALKMIVLACRVLSECCTSSELANFNYSMLPKCFSNFKNISNNYLLLVFPEEAVLFLFCNFY